MVDFFIEEHYPFKKLNIRKIENLISQIRNIKEGLVLHTNLDVYCYSNNFEEILIK